MIKPLSKLKGSNFLILTAIIILGGFLRLFQITKNALWYDEAFSAEMVKHSLTQIIELGKFDVHPPFYYFLLRWWTLIAGDSETALRGFSVIFGILLIISVYLLVKKLFNSRVALIASFLITIAPFFIQYSRESRMYMLGAFLAVASTFFLWQAFWTKKKIKTLFYLGGYLIFTVTGIYTHYFLAFTTVAQIIGILLGILIVDKKTRQFLSQKIGYFFLSLFLTIVFYLPWLMVFLKQLQQVKKDYWIPALSVISFFRTFLVITIGSIEIKTLAILVLPFILILLVSFLATRSLKSQKPQQKIALILVLNCLFIPFILGALVSISRSVFLDRYFIFAGTFEFILFAYFVAKLKNKILMPILFVTTGIVIATACTNVFGLDPKQIGMRELNQTLQQYYRPGEKIIHSASFTFIVFQYYNKNEQKSAVYTPSGELPHYGGSALLSNNELITDISKYLKNTKNFWDCLLYTSPSPRDS